MIILRNSRTNGAIPNPSDTTTKTLQNNLNGDGNGNGTQKKDSSQIDFGKHFYQMKYFEHYQTFLDGIENKGKVICELFLFRAWTAQFGYRLCCGEGALAEKIIYEVVNLSNTLGKGIFELYNSVNFEEIMSGDIPSLIEKRWGEYDDVFIKNRSDSKLAAEPISAKLCNFCGIEDRVLWYVKTFGTSRPCSATCPLKNKGI